MIENNPPQLQKAFSLCVYCGSRMGDDPIYSDVARQVGHWIGRNNGQLVYGGGRRGLMGILADAALEANARVVGIITEALCELEHEHPGCHELVVVSDMHQRKHLMAQHAQAFIALAGGIGTFEEFFEVWSWRHLGYHDKPLGLLNTEGFYDGLIDFTHHCLKAKFMDRSQMQVLHIDTNWETLLPKLIDEIQRNPSKGSPMGSSLK